MAYRVYRPRGKSDANPRWRVVHFEDGVLILKDVDPTNLNKATGPLRAYAPGNWTSVKWE